MDMESGKSTHASLEKIDMESGKNTQIEGLILFVSSTIALSLIYFHYKTVDGSPVPTVIFQDSFPLFHAFILSLNFSFFGSFISLTLRPAYPSLSKCCLVVATVSIATGFTILLYVIVPTFNSAKHYLHSSF